MHKKTKIFFLFLLFPSFCSAFTIGKTKVDLNAKLGRAYDDNITYTSTDVKSDLRSDVTVGFKAAYEAKTTTINLSANVKQQFYDKNTNFNNMSEDGTFTLSQELSKLDRFKISDKFVRADEPRSFEDQFGNTGNRYGYRKNTFTFDYSREFNKQFSALINFVNDLYQPSRDDLVNSYLNSGTLELDYALLSHTIIIGMAQFIDREYDGASSVKTTRVAGGLKHYLTNQVFADLRGGMDFTKRGHDKIKRGQYISATLANELDENTIISLNFLKEESSSYYAQDIFKSQRVSFNFFNQIYKRLGFKLSAFYGEGKYTGSGIQDIFRGVNTGFVYDLWHNIKADINYSYSRTTSNVDTRDYTKNVAMFGINAEF